MLRFLGNFVGAELPSQPWTAYPGLFHEREINFDLFKSL